MTLVYQSTRDANNTVTASQAILQGLATDGGLFTPLTYPKVDLDFETLKDDIEVIITIAAKNIVDLRKIQDKGITYADETIYIAKVLEEKGIKKGFIKKEGRRR